MDLGYTLPRCPKCERSPVRGHVPDSDPTPDQVTLPITRVSPRSGAVEPLKGLNPKRQASRRPLTARSPTRGGRRWRSQSGSPCGRENNRGDEADVTAPHPHRGPKPPPTCSGQGSVDRAEAAGVPKDDTSRRGQEDLVAQNLPVQSVRRILNRFRKPLDLVLVSGTAEANDKATKAAFSNQERMLPLRRQSGAARKRASRQCHNCQSYGHSSRHLLSFCAMR
ncbi:hypothetical protein EVAR_98259_1 [Eumeta japonica]|uniref:Uncharacterized protein n=1 Tax=Eumeta variegata TaxID=151549 RepID=A0A4C2A3M5_EUMVA|nr:hypothetical protein EVAR_98259_1 [Eumeta japonica]